MASNAFDGDREPVWAVLSLGRRPGARFPARMAPPEGQSQLVSRQRRQAPGIVVGAEPVVELDGCGIRRVARPWPVVAFEQGGVDLEAVGRLSSSWSGKVFVYV